MLTLWFVKIITAHLLSDFVLQPSSWIEKRNTLHFRSPELVYHAFISAIFAFAFTGFSSWEVLTTVLVSHYAIDLWKSYRPKTLCYFVLDQGLHVLVFMILALVLFKTQLQLGMVLLFGSLIDNIPFWISFMGILFLTYPSGIIIGLLTAKWREQLTDSGTDLGNAGKWIGILERLIIFILVVFDQYAAIGLLTAAKSILRYGDTKDAPKKTEYVLIGTLISVITAVSVGLIVKMNI